MLKDLNKEHLSAGLTEMYLQIYGFKRQNLCSIVFQGKIAKIQAFKGLTSHAIPGSNLKDNQREERSIATPLRFITHLALVHSNSPPRQVFSTSTDRLH